MTPAIFILVVAIIYDCFCFGTGSIAAQTKELYIDHLFEKYGTSLGNNVTVMKTKRFDELLASLSLGRVGVVCQLNDTECLKDKFLGHEVKVKDPLLSRKRRGVALLDDGHESEHRAHSRQRRGGNHGNEPEGEISEEKKEEHKKDWKAHLKNCLPVRNITAMYGVNETYITKADFANVCPYLIQQIDAKVCTHYHKRYPALQHPEGPPSDAETWGYGFIAITICSLLSLAVIAMIPCLKKSFYNMMMAFLVALAVGTLCGDALLHLIPHAFIEGANLAAGITVNAEQREQQHYAQVWRAMFVLVGIYLFFIVEQIMKLRASCRRGNSDDGAGHAHNNDVALDDVVGNSNAGATVAVVDATENKGSDGHGHSHGGNKDITGETKVASVAWMVIVGDGFHNFSDGLAVGAAFSASISSGVSTTIAIFCHELPHELGDFAILLKAGMTIKQAIVYNLVSTVLAYLGLVIGILAGENELGRHVILSLTAGLFLYISLVDMMGELTDHDTPRIHYCTVICQHLGLICGIVLMLIISLYEHDM